jgi:hypothetical protein
MDDLNSLYIRLLQFGLLILRDAVYSQNTDWAKAEIEMLHNIPHLICENNLAEHHYYWFTEKKIYLNKILILNDADINTKVRAFYEPIWNKMEPIISKIENNSNEIP